MKLIRHKIRITRFARALLIHLSPLFVRVKQTFHLPSPFGCSSSEEAKSVGFRHFTLKDGRILRQTLFKKESMDYCKPRLRGNLKGAFHVKQKFHLPSPFGCASSEEANSVGFRHFTLKDGRILLQTLFRKEKNSICEPSLNISITSICSSQTDIPFAIPVWLYEQRGSKHRQLPTLQAERGQNPSPNTFGKESIDY
ncbi:hypothetical protein CEXT_503501 [Caerostris extrusa]|uniref:Ribosomal protein L5 n=1 Tax=Caerostris extrusa TaxID=172846 RepID=A0AAV4NYD8_CAEEX|nr:hypothetical protein CEXT_503501 [Caerostris extrusa]